MNQERIKVLEKEIVALKTQHEDTAGNGKELEEEKERSRKELDKVKMELEKEKELMRKELEEKKKELETAEENESALKVRKNKITRN